MKKLFANPWFQLFGTMAVFAGTLIKEWAGMALMFIYFSLWVSNYFNTFSEKE